MRFLVAAIVIFATAPASAASSTTTPTRRAVKKKSPPAPPVELVALNTHETFVLRPDAKGHFGPKQLHGWNRFLRCHHTGRVHQMATRLASLIYDTSKHFNFGKILVVAGYRAPKVAREKGNPKSPHKKGLACDFRVDGIANTELRDFLRGAFGRIGVGYYPNSDFVHLDVRQKVSAFWIDYSGPGERAKYSKTPAADLEAEKVAQTPPPTDENDDEKPVGPEPQGGPGPGVTAPNSPALVPVSP